ncbi:unnamed protein product [Bemisia tabaci]|uniref:Uncharacterized protein n=1 Tax=Bemisia tabaci TaxID=7038 RepID=A0A9P0F463_BEMTA|nr:unnamed protein product [Bemisia tabaci]
MGSWNSTLGAIVNFRRLTAQDAIVSVGDCKQPIDPPNSISFYQHKNFGGKRCNVQVRKGCQPICPDLDHQASSAEGDAGCVHVYEKPNCEGYVGELTDLKVALMAFYSNFKWTTYQDKISSISDCSNRTVSFFEHKHYKGKRCDFNKVNGCQQMCPDLDKKASSVRGDISCIRGYDDANCTSFLGRIYFPRPPPYITTYAHRFIGPPNNFKNTFLQDTISSFRSCETAAGVNFPFSRPLGGFPWVH